MHAHRYHSVKKEYSSERAWKHLAGAQEMLAATLFMQDSMDTNRTDYYRYFDAAIMT